jgi:hypothetical protein
LLQQPDIRPCLSEDEHRNERADVAPPRSASLSQPLIAQLYRAVAHGCHPRSRLWFATRPTLSSLLWHLAPLCQIPSALCSGCGCSACGGSSVPVGRTRSAQWNTVLQPRGRQELAAQPTKSAKRGLRWVKPQDQEHTSALRGDFLSHSAAQHLIVDSLPKLLYSTS